MTANRSILLLVLSVLALPRYASSADPIVAGGTLTITESLDPNENPKTINADECTGTSTDNLTIIWDFTSGFTSGDSIRITVSTASGCSTTTTGVYTGTLVSENDISSPAASDRWPRTGDTTHQIPAGDLVSVLAAAGASVSCTDSNTTLYVCALDVTANTVLSSSIALNTQAPAAPTGVTAQPGNSALYVSWTAPAGSPSASTYNIRATSQSDPSDTHTRTGCTGTSNQRIDGLTNGVTYDVVVFAVSSAGNKSAESNTATGTPVPTDDFWTRYRQAGGVEEGGCNGGPAGVLSPLLLLAALWLRRRP